MGKNTRAALPGQIGNFATAAHRATNGEPFVMKKEQKLPRTLADGAKAAPPWLVETLRAPNRSASYSVLSFRTQRPETSFCTRTRFSFQATERKQLFSWPRRREGLDLGDSRRRSRPFQPPSPRSEAPVGDARPGQATRAASAKTDLPAGDGRSGNRQAVAPGRRASGPGPENR